MAQRIVVIFDPHRSQPKNLVSSSPSCAAWYCRSPHVLNDPCVVWSGALGGDLYCVVCWDIDRDGISAIVATILVFLYSWTDRCQADRLAGAECIARTARLHAQ